MDYYYDVLLNFQDSYSMFYEWDSEDVIDYVKKIPLFHVDAKTIVNMISKKIKIDQELMNLIENKTKLKGNNTLKYTSIFSDGKNSIALEFNDEGMTINKSSLNYQIISDDNYEIETRQDLKIKKILKLEIDSIYNNKEYSKLKYIYLEWFSNLLNDVDKMYQNMLLKLQNKLTEKEYHIYELIKLSYNNV